MSAQRWRWSFIGVWLSACCAGFVAVNSLTARNWLLLLVFAIIPPLMSLWLWNEDRPMLLGSLQRGHKQ